MELSQLRYFCSVAETENMRKSAQMLNIVQPALSQSIGRLENNLDVRLFEHVGRNIRLTPEGELFYKKIQPILEELDTTEKEVRTFARNQTKMIRMKILAATSIVIDAVAEFIRLNPDVSFELTQNKDDRHCDIKIETIVDTTAMDAKKNSLHPSVDMQCFTENIGVAVPSGSPYEKGISPRDLKDEGFISLAGSRKFRELCDHLCFKQGFHPKVIFDSDNPSVVKKMIALGLGVGFWPEHSWGSIEGSGARWIPIEDEGFERTIGVELMAVERPSEAASDLYEFLITYMRDIWV